MIDLGPHAVFITWAYIGVAAGILGLIAWTLLDARTTARQLAALGGLHPASAPSRAHQLMRYILFGLPLIALVALVAVFVLSIDRDPSLVRSVLIDRPAPAFALDAVPELGVPGFDTAALKGQVSVVNVFASWCIPCRDEHPQLMALKEIADIRLLGVNQSDAPENARAFLAELGNPYDAVGADRDRRVSIDWGVYGVPETFVVDADGVIGFKHVGPLTPESFQTELLPAIARARN
ncbi:MAG: heme exporter protein CcmD [Candidatus Devosia euplotis]|nr:heme exporter protein CcmD [Candidatus Devosia euplotis]